MPPQRPVDRRDLAHACSSAGTADARRRQGPDHRHARRQRRGASGYAAVHRRGGRRHRPRRDHGQHRRQRPGPVRRCRRPRCPRSDRQCRPRPRLREPSDGRHLPDLGVRLPRRHHDGRRARVLLAAPGAARRGRPDRRLRHPRRLLTRHDAVRRRADRARALPARRGRRAAGGRPSADPERLLVAGTRTHAQAAALRDVWEPLAVALGELEANGQDVIVDAGRLGLAGSPQPLLDCRRR